MEDNIKVNIDGDMLTITIRLPKTGTISASGKSEVLASTRGNIDVGGGLKLGLNLYRSRKE